MISVLLAAQLASSSPAGPNPLSRVSGKSFYPNKMINTEVLNIKADIHPFTFGGPKNLIPRKSLGINYCKACIEFADQALNELLNAILNLGVIGECSKVCTYIADKIGSQVAGVVCNLLCDYVGIKEFVKIIETADLDPIYYCELLKACSIYDNGDANITSFSVSPSRGPQGVFVIDLEYVSFNGTGTGELYIGVRTVDGIPIEESFLLEAQKPGSYRTQVSLNAIPDPDCDPFQQECEKWLSGVYTVETGF